MSTNKSANGIIDAVGGPENIRSLTHCATRLRFELNDADLVKAADLEQIPEVLGTMAQSGDRYQVIVGGAVESMYSAINALPQMANRAKAGESDEDIKAAARSKARGKSAWLDTFFEYLSDSFRPILGVLLGASLIIAFAAVLDALGVVDFRAADKAPGWVFVDSMWHSVFYFLPIMVAFNASKKLLVDPWLGATIMAAFLTPDFLKLSNSELYTTLQCVENEAIKQTTCSIDVFGLPLTLPDYSGNVFVPLMMVPVLALVYRNLKKIIPSNVQMVFIPFISMIVLIPLTAFLIGPLGIWIGNGLGFGLAWMNTTAPFIFAIAIPLIYPFLVPLGLHWPLNAMMLVNIQTLGYDFIQGPMGAWNFACFGTTAGVLYLAIRDKDNVMRQTASGALAAGLFGGISEPSLYGIHLRFKLAYSRLLAGCLAGGLTIAVLSLPFGGVTTDAFVFTSLLTISVFDPAWVYLIAIAVAFTTSMLAVIVLDYRPREERPSYIRKHTVTLPDNTVGVPIAGKVISLDDAGDQVFASRALGEGFAVVPEVDETGNATVVAPITGTVSSVTKSGHAFGIKSADGTEVLVHVGIDTVNLKGDGFDVKVAKGEQITAGHPLVAVDFKKVAAAGYATTVIVTVTNTRSFAAVTPVLAEHATVLTPGVTTQR
ncbi:glucose PTS transporter subunit IIA [Arcanobacterium pinnipediorum]|uniref:Glucose PTS transporter subunit IIA n=1 Tax=Arcanobacterium pinnipediorum TaxID=1503041 RepID=A0ABY5AG42_9ACTO|nr:glucose PTS transporter subunit IIA [Arcanobacterium pinnipediorum]USR79158.1 glucose PTS transporter subunit IIA [Arcanobacterium pinnipediorum]